MRSAAHLSYPGLDLQPGSDQQEGEPVSDAATQASHVKRLLLASLAVVTAIVLVASSPVGSDARAFASFVYQVSQGQLMPCACAACVDLAASSAAREFEAHGVPAAESTPTG
jgi:hypothetical protein